MYTEDSIVYTLTIMQVITISLYMFSISVSLIKTYVFETNKAELSMGLKLLICKNIFYTKLKNVFYIFVQNHNFQILPADFLTL